MVKLSKNSYTCPVCSSTKTKYFLTAFHAHGKDALDQKKFDYFECQKCQSVFLVNTKFTKNYYDTYYNFEGYYPERVGIKDSLEKMFDKYSQTRKQNIIMSSVKNNDGKIKILDVGAGEGKFLLALSPEVFEKYGIELDEKSYKICKEKKLKVYNEDILKKDFKKQKFDVITLWHVIEHIPNPQKLFEKLSSLLEKDGIIVIATPNTDSIGFRIAKEKWFHMDAPRHVILFNELGMKTVSEQSGFVMQSMRSDKFEFPFDLFWSMKQAKKNVLMFPFLKPVDKETLTYVIKKSHSI
jgi:2-polyprenyl-3-methyl-5-hydroxy-6-metoxy-1,4-benzoquinol methylase